MSKKNKVAKMSSKKVKPEVSREAQLAEEAQKLYAEKIKKCTVEVNKVLEKYGMALKTRQSIDIIPNQR